MTTPQPAALPELPEPDAYLFQHEETGNTMFVDRQQVEWGFEANNPRLQKISGAYTADQMRAYALAAMQPKPAEVPDEDILKIAEFAGLIGPGSRIGESHSAAVRFARAILALRTAQQATPEPVGQAQQPSGIWRLWMCAQETGHDFLHREGSEADMKAELTRLSAHGRDVWLIAPDGRKVMPEPVGEPVYWEWRHLSTHPDTVDFGQWSEWQRVEARSRLHTVDDALQEIRRYIAQGYKYELRALYTRPTPAPQQVPMTELDVAHALCAQPMLVDIACAKASEVMVLVRAVEAHHGITAQAKGGGNG